MAGPPSQQPYPPGPNPQQPYPSGSIPQQAYPPYPPGPPSQPIWSYPPPPYYAPPPPPQRNNRQLITIILVTLAVLIALSGVVFVVRPLVQAAVSPAQELATPTSWVYGDNDLAVYISWTEQNGALSGTYAETYYFASARPSIPLVRTDTDGFTGIHSGPKVSLIFNQSSQSMTGALSFRTFTLARPDPATGTIQPVTLHPGSEVDYNAAAAKVMQQHPTLVYSSALTGNVSDWPSDGGCSPQSDGYHITAAVICYPDLAEQSDVTLSVQAKQISGESNVAYGVAFRRASKGNYYFFGVDGNGKWIVQKVVNDDGTRLVDFTANPAINSGLNQINTLKVAAKGAHFTFFANGTQLGSIDDSTFSSGKWGLAGEDGIEVVFTNFMMTATP